MAAPELAAHRVGKIAAGDPRGSPLRKVSAAPCPLPQRGKKRRMDLGGMRIGVMAGLSAEPEKEISRVREFGLASCQVVSWKPELFTPEIARALAGAAEKYGVEISTFWCGTPGSACWNFAEGPATIGLVPRGRRPQRIAALKKGSDFAKACGIRSVTTHVGFLPEDPNDPLFHEAVAAIREVVEHCAKNGQEFWFETGQETPVALLRTIQAVGSGNLGINLDPANLVMYGKANPVDALDVFGKYVRGCHAKDGLYPTDGYTLGREVPLGEGKVNFPALIKRLKELGFEGALTIEREISGTKQAEDIRKAKAMLESILASA